MLFISAVSSFNVEADRCGFSVVLFGDIRLQRCRDESFFLHDLCLCSDLVFQMETNVCYIDEAFTKERLEFNYHFFPPCFVLFFRLYTFVLAAVGCEPHHQLTGVPGTIDRSREAGGPLGGKLRPGLPLGHGRWRAPQTGKHWHVWTQKS